MESLACKSDTCFYYKVILNAVTVRTDLINRGPNSLICSDRNSSSLAAVSLVTVSVLKRECHQTQYIRHGLFPLVITAEVMLYTSEIGRAGDGS